MILPLKLYASDCYITANPVCALLVLGRVMWLHNRIFAPLIYIQQIFIFVCIGTLKNAALVLFLFRLSRCPSEPTLYDEAK